MTARGGRSEWSALLAAAVCILTWLAWPSTAAEATPFERGNKLYEEGKFKEAAAVYESLSQGRMVSAETLFNLANTYFRDGQLGRAIHSYLRARLVTPRDPDIVANLRFARGTVRGDYSMHETVMERLLGYLTLNELAAWSSLALWLWLGLLIAIRLRPAWRPPLRAWTFAAALIFLFFAGWLAGALSQRSQAIAIVAEDGTTARFGPVDASQSALTLPAGSELRVLDRKDDWLQVAARGNRTGWVKTNEVLIVP